MATVRGAAARVSACRQRLCTLTITNPMAMTAVHAASLASIISRRSLEEPLVGPAHAPPCHDRHASHNPHKKSCIRSARNASQQYSIEQTRVHSKRVTPFPFVLTHKGKTCLREPMRGRLSISTSSCLGNKCVLYATGSTYCSRGMAPQTRASSATLQGSSGHAR